MGGVEPSRRNITTPLISSLSGSADLPRLETGRLRSTCWLAAVAEGIGLRAFMDAAGSCSQRLGEIVATLPHANEPTAVAVMGGAR